jgi:hypothetical protein
MVPITCPPVLELEAAARHADRFSALVHTEHFERAKHDYERAGLVAEWEKIVSLVSRCHHRKVGFISGFENAIAGCGPGSAPSFLERAKATWGERQRKNDP